MVSHGLLNRISLRRAILPQSPRSPQRPDRIFPWRAWRLGPWLIRIVFSIQVAAANTIYYNQISLPDGAMTLRRVNADGTGNQPIPVALPSAPQPAILEIRVIRYDGSDDREILRLADGLWIHRLAWAPDGTALAFDVSPQLVDQGWPLLGGDLTRSEIHAVNLVSSAASLSSDVQERES